MSVKLIWHDKINIEVSKRIKNEVTQALSTDSSLIIDLSGVEVIDTAGIQLLLAAAKEIKQKGGSLSFEGQVPKDVSRKLVMAGVTHQMISEGALLASSLMDFIEG